QFNSPIGLAMDRSGNLYVADRINNAIRKGVPVFRAPTLAMPPQSQQVNTGATVTLNVAAIGSELRYQWKKDGVAIAGATNSSYEIAGAAASDTGSYLVVVISGGGTTESPAALLTVNSASRLSNLSARGLVPTGGDLTVGFVI